MWWAIIVIVFAVWFFYRLNKIKDDDDLESFFDLQQRVETNENRYRINQLVEFHNKRVKAGADGRKSYERLVKELKELGGIKDII